MSNISLFYSSKASSRPSTILKSPQSYGLLGEKKELRSSKVRVENGKEWGTNDFTRAVSGSTFHCLSWMSVVKKRDGGLLLLQHREQQWQFFNEIVTFYLFSFMTWQFSKLLLKVPPPTLLRLKMIMQRHTKIRCWLTFKKFTLVNNATTLAVARPLLVVSQVVFISVLYFFGRATLATKTTQKRPSSSRIAVIASIDFEEMVKKKNSASSSSQIIISRSEFLAYHNHGQFWTQTCRYVA